MQTTVAQPYVSWKGASTNSIVPAFSRPVLTAPGPAFKARPINHWRKQLMPTLNSGSSSRRAGVGMPMDLPAGSIYLGNVATNTNCLLNDPKTDSVGLKEDISDPNSAFFTFNANKNEKIFDSANNRTLCVACNPETTVIKRATTILNKQYYSDNKNYMKSRSLLYIQNLTENPNCPPAQCASVNQPVFKPNNSQFQTQGAVDSSSRITKLKLDTVNKNAASYKTVFGTTASKYLGSSDTPYFAKSKYQSTYQSRKPPIIHGTGL